MSSDVARLFRIVSKVTRKPIDTITLESDLRADLNIDSIQGLQLVAEVEEAFDVRIPDEQIHDYTDVQSVLTLIESVR